MSFDGLEGLVEAAYERHVEYMLRPSPLLEAFRRESDAWWAEQTRWFKIRRRARRAVRGRWNSARFWLADKIYKYPESD